VATSQAGDVRTIVINQPGRRRRYRRRQR